MSGGRRVVVTGMGAITAAGAGVETFWRACIEGRSALRPLRGTDFACFGEPLAGEVAEPLPALEERAAGLAIAATAEAIAATGYAGAGLPPASGIVVGTCLGGARSVFSWLDAGRRGEDPGHAPAPSSTWLACPASRLAAAHRLNGPVVSLSSACSSGAAAIAHATDCIRRGEADLMLAGGTDALSAFVVSGFWILRALTPTCVRPFDRRRDGLALGEGAGFVVLEELAHAAARGAILQAEILGSGSAGDAHHMTGPSPTGDGALRAMLAALQDARRTPDCVGFISAHGTGTPQNDRMEALAINRLFGVRAGRIPVNSIKPIIGHTLGAAGALDAILCVKILQEGVVPPTINSDEPDPACDLGDIPRSARRQRVRCALSTTSAFAGHNVSLLLGLP
jgi:3-oxoacyl-[acyl-carrier-protein] synthase II